MDEVVPDRAESPRQRPIGVSILAVLTILFGSLLFFWTPVALFLLACSQDAESVAYRKDTLLLCHSVLNSLFDGCISLALVVLSLGLWQLNERARKATVQFALYLAIFELARGAFNAVVMTPRTYPITVAEMGELVPAEYMPYFYSITVAITILAACIAIVSYLSVAIYLSRPKVKKAFEPRAE